jgi:hypothetical protein
MMWTRVAPIVLGVVVLGAGALAFMRPSAPSEPTPPASNDHANDGDRAPTPRSDLPPGHPQVNGADPSGASAPAAMQPSAPPGQEHGATITWTVPSDWQTVPNPSAMRVATYRVPGDGAEMAVARAGGTTDANIERWRGQFAGAADDKPKRTEKTVHGLKVTIVELAGTYTAMGMMPGAAPGEPHTGWALLAAIVEAPGFPYFFKLVGPAAAVRAARPHFDGLVASISPS